MASFDELLSQAQQQNEMDILQNNLTYILQDKSKHFTVYNRIQPFLPHIEDGGNLDALSLQLQSPYSDNPTIKKHIHTLVNQAKTNERLKKVLQVVIGL